MNQNTWAVNRECLIESRLHSSGLKYAIGKSKITFLFSIKKCPCVVDSFECFDICFHKIKNNCIFLFSINLFATMSFFIIDLTFRIENSRCVFESQYLRFHTMKTMINSFLYFTLKSYRHCEFVQIQFFISLLFSWHLFYQIYKWYFVSVLLVV